MSAMNRTATRESGTHANADGHDDRYRLNIELKCKEEYLAPVHMAEEPPARGGSFYAVNLKKGHTVEKHFEVIGRKIDGHRWSSEWYDAHLSGDDKEEIRRDPGVRSIVQYGGAVWG